MKIEYLTYEERYCNLENPSTYKAIDSFLIKSSGEIIRNLNGKKLVYVKAAKEDFKELENEIVEFINKADHTVCFVDNMNVSITIVYEDGTELKVERGLAYEDEFFDSIIEDYLDEHVEC